jgi:hypothetical protein
MDFRSQLVGTLRAIRHVLELPGVLVIGSEVPNLLEPGAASTLVRSQDVDIGVEVSSHADVKERMLQVHDLQPSAEEPSVWLPAREGLIEVNFVGIDPVLRDIGESYVLDDRQLPLLVIGVLSLLRPGPRVEVEELRVPVPRPASLLLEKLVTERSGVKGDRDLLVVLGLLLTTGEADLEELESAYRSLPGELRYAVRSNLTLLSLLRPHQGMPDPELHRARVAALLRRLESGEEDRP